jgi:hypothetical protein
MRSAARRPTRLIGVRPHELRGPRHGHLVRIAVGTHQREQDSITGAAVFWVVLSIIGLAVETAVIIVLGCRATERNERESAPPAEQPWAPG